MRPAFYQQIRNKIKQIKAEGLYKDERIITSAQKSKISISSFSEDVLNLCANNYLGLANHPKLVESAKLGMDKYGFGMASVRFICGTQDLHKELEKKLSEFLGKEDTILYTSCFDANTGLFEALLTEEDAVISDALNHASIIDGVRLCKAMRFRYANNNMQELEQKLIIARKKKVLNILIVTDGVFSMDGVVANLPAICNLAEKYDALVMVDDSHAVGFMGKKGSGTPEYHNVVDRIDIVTGTLGKAMGGASGGYVSGKKEVIDWLRQHSRPYLFSNSLAPAILSASICALDLLKESNRLRDRLWKNTSHFRTRMKKVGFTLGGLDHAIVPIMLGDAKLATEFANRALNQGIYVVSFSFPVVPKGEARVRVQMSAAHNLQQLDRAVDAFIQVGKNMGIVNEN
ncbi:2-amino-3-ketobutyrate coenzyme A ligase [Candidatus Photodesmus blepharus]|uniref:2-amino-3-ketobutyrate coenzyme A ligase n=1 Tax=Candidatus Photodesmus blepharonis TaxID=1179155 RepID=A0A084CN93_9GAMM|nr:glycine C-acetyltransferase [Candidatus Photodesmus blepharus]KEY91272.1 2-amino-3-ketobutyrate coenzyme A ligase [Candidatus Photodesmus blepharus]